MRLIPGLNRWSSARGSPRYPPGRRRPRPPVTGLFAELLEDRTLPSAGFGTELLPRLSGGPDRALGNVLSPRGPGYPQPPTVAVAPQGNPLHAVQPVSTLTPAGQLVGGTPALTPTLSTSAAEPAAGAAFTLPLESVFAAAAPGGTVTTPTAAVAVPAGRGVVVALAGTGEVLRGVQSDTPAGLNVLTPRATSVLGPLPGFADAQATVTPLTMVPDALPEKDAHALLPAWAVASLPPAVAQANPAVLPERLAGREDRGEDLTMLIPADVMTAPAILPGTPNLAAGLAPLENPEAADGRAVRPRLDVLALSSLFAIGLWGFGQFRDSFSVAEEPRKPLALRQDEEEEDR